jgi:hypothetical protein
MADSKNPNGGDLILYHTPGPARTLRSFGNIEGLRPGA